MLGLDVGDGSVCAECIPAGDGVDFISCGRLEDCLRASMWREYCSEQTIGFNRAWGCPSQRTEEVIVCNRAMNDSVSKTTSAVGVQLTLSLKKGVCDETDTLLCLQKKFK